MPSQLWGVIWWNMAGRGSSVFWSRSRNETPQKLKWGSQQFWHPLSIGSTSATHSEVTQFDIRGAGCPWARASNAAPPAARCESPAAVSRRLFLLLFFNSHGLIWGVNCYLLLLCSDSLQQPEGWTHLCCSSHLSVSPCVLSVSSDSLIKENAKNKRSAARFNLFILVFVEPLPHVCVMWRSLCGGRWTTEEATKPLQHSQRSTGWARHHHQEG